MCRYVLEFQEISSSCLELVGGKGLNLGELMRIEGIYVPDGFCITTKAYKFVVQKNPEIKSLIRQLSALKREDHERIKTIGQKIRDTITHMAVPITVKEKIMKYYIKEGEDSAFAIRSSATAEDLPHVSFAGQQESYLNIKGLACILDYISQCWASLFTERAIIYRMKNGFAHDKVYLSVVIQKMVLSQHSGVLFTADPVTSNRHITSIDASFGLGEAVVSGIVNADNYKIRDGKIIEKIVPAKERAVLPLPNGSTKILEIDDDLQKNQVLTDDQILKLVDIGQRVKRHFGQPQDIEWCLVDGEFYIVQSRPITTLFPIPELKDSALRVYGSVGHMQMMTEAIKPLGISFFRLISDYKVDFAGGRLFVDISHDLASGMGRKIVLSAMTKTEPLIKNAVLNLTKRQDFIDNLPKGKKVFKIGSGEFTLFLPIYAINIYRKNDISVVRQLISENEESIKRLKQEIKNQSGDALVSFILKDQRNLKTMLYDPRGIGIIFVGAYAANWLNRKMAKWLEEEKVSDILSQSVPNNITSDMGLALLDVSDVVRRYPEVIHYFKQDPQDDTFFEYLKTYEGGREVGNAMQHYLDLFGMRCPGEIDITKSRWSERPTALVPMILSNIKNFEPGERRKKIHQGKRKAEEKEQNLLSRLEKLPDGKRKAKKTKKMIHVLRKYIGYREYPKYFFIQRYFIYKQALKREAKVMLKNGLIQDVNDIYYLTFDEFRNAVNTHELDYFIIKERQAAYEVYEKLTPPRLMTSEGETLFGEYQIDGLPEGAMVGNPVSTGIIEGKARVIFKMEDADIEDGDILVTTFTDPSWTPLFVSIKGLVTEVGGQMTHGAVIAREYGLPAVVGVENATKRIQDGQWIRVNGMDGYVELL